MNLKSASSSVNSFKIESLKKWTSEFFHWNFCHYYLHLLKCYSNFSFSILAWILFLPKCISKIIPIFFQQYVFSVDFPKNCYFKNIWPFLILIEPGLSMMSRFFFIDPCCTPSNTRQIFVIDRCISCELSSFAMTFIWNFTIGCQLSSLGEKNVFFY
jgi:hypothetical protein